jgi:hypothetical protein
VVTAKCLRVGWYAFELVIKAHENVKIEIRSKSKRDLAFADVRKALKIENEHKVERTNSMNSRHGEMRSSSEKSESRHSMDKWLETKFLQPLKDVPIQVIATLPPVVSDQHDQEHMIGPR